MLFAVSFDRDLITDVRHGVAGHAAGAGLSGLRLEGFVLAVNEIMTNAIRHGGGSGTLRMWRTVTELSCAISDPGSGTPAQLNGHELPPTSATGGRGLWLARYLCDTVEISTGTDGTCVRLAMSI